MTQTTFSQKALPLFNQIDPNTIEKQISEKLTANRENLSSLLSQPNYSWDNLMLPLENMSDELHKLWSPISHLHGVMESEALRKAYNETLPLITSYHTELSQNKKLSEAISSIAKSPEFATLNPAQQKIIENDMRDFKLSGIDLPEEKKKRVADLQLQLSQLMTKFSENILDATQGWSLHLVDEKQLEGLPEQSLHLAKETAKQRGLEGYVITLDYPSYSAAIKFLRDRELRKTLYYAYSTRASDQGPNAHKWDNTQIIEDILKTRTEIAKLVGFNNYAEYSLATKMAKKPDDVLHFLQDLLVKSKPIAQRELKDIEEFARTLDGLDHLEVWDIPYYSEKYFETTFHFSPEELRKYFPVQTALNGMFALINKLYGITIKKQSNIETWHPHAEFFCIYDDRNELRGGFYIDLYARQHKRDGAWMDDCRARFRLNDQEIQYPVAYLTCNFMPPVENQPTLLTHDDVLTLFHEFGHCLHHMLTQVDYPSVAGINGVAWDAVEFPSQFLENFCWEKESLAYIAAHHETGELLPDDLYQKMIKAKNFQTGLQMIRQLEFSLFDFRLHLEYDSNIARFTQPLLNQIRNTTNIIPMPEFNRFQDSFSHIFAGSYAAGYYSYKWAEVLSADAYSKFEENGIFDRTTGLSFMQNILEVGGVRDAMFSFIAFRGREPKIDALLRHNGITN